MKLLSSHFTAPALVAALALLAGCSSDNPPANNTGGTNSGGSSSGGKAGSPSGGSVSVGGTGAGGAAAGSGGSAGSSGGAGGGTAGAGTAGGAAVDASFATVKGVISASCFGNGCHGQEGNPLQMKADDLLLATLKGHVTKNCGKLVDTTNPAQSALVTILKGNCGTPPNTTDRMPFGSCFEGDTEDDNPTCVPAAKIASIQAWIANGAAAQ